MVPGWLLATKIYVSPEIMFLGRTTCRPQIYGKWLSGSWIIRAWRPMQLLRPPRISLSALRAIRAYIRETHYAFSCMRPEVNKIMTSRRIPSAQLKADSTNTGLYEFSERCPNHNDLKPFYIPCYPACRIEQSTEQSPTLSSNYQPCIRLCWHAPPPS